MSTGRERTILLVEDNRADVRLTVEAFQEAGLNSNLFIARDAIEAMDRLRKGVVLPDVILLDLNLPRGSGRDVLTAIKADPRLRLIPVIILTTSESDDDVVFCYREHASCFIPKPLDFREFVEVIRLIEEVWLRRARLPLAADPDPKFADQLTSGTTLHTETH